ncbi:QSPP-like protein, partial [Mya arenaria]
MSVINSPRDAGRYIAENSKDVKINDVGVKKVAEIMAECVKSGTYSIKSWKKHELNPSIMDEAALNWIFVADTLNFSFWSADEEQKYVVKYKGKEHTGYWSLCAAMNRALDEKIPLTDPKYFASITKDQLAHVLRSDSSTEIPMFEERLEVLREAGTVMMEKYGGKFVNVIKKCENSAQSLLKIVTDDFPSYRDVTEFCGKTVAIYKRVQILIADIWACFEGQGFGEFRDIDTITMFADYRIPQALLFFGVLEYSPELMEYLKKDSMMNIWATELVNEETRRNLGAQLRGGDEPDGNNRSVGQNHTGSGDLLVNSILIDHYLWDYRRERADEMTDIPFHKI